jgi:hypothetical protein
MDSLCVGVRPGDAFSGGGAMSAEQWASIALAVAFALGVIVLALDVATMRGVDD